MSRAAPRPLSAALEDFTSALAPATLLARVQERWDSAIGSSIAAHARPTAAREGVLTVACDSAVWAQELDMMASELIAALNAALGESAVCELRCRVG